MTTHSQWETFSEAIRFFTRLPGPMAPSGNADALAGAMRYFSTVGLIVGVIAAFAFGITLFFWPKTLAVLTAMIVAVLVTGAMHEDGWSDMADGFGGACEREKTLDVMRDSRVGNFGAIALVLLLAARFFTLIEIDLVIVALVAGHAVSRLCATGVFHLLDYARPDGKAAPFTDKLGKSDLVFATVMTLPPVLLLLLFSPLQSILALLFAAGATFWLYRLFKRRIGGYTGDCLGAVQQLAEVAFYGGLLCRFS
ncbi:MAG: adenosylcobinamide-GDP ribazoletransferase [Candidatus Accumulibacter sp.]|jgi:adenosylcobinamide-GDP ribazoletransferase|nr:adenosylcobinamide-GDP ribazoletransferase [Accumulibacter sp.]